MDEKRCPKLRVLTHKKGEDSVEFKELEKFFEESKTENKETSKTSRQTSSSEEYDVMNIEHILIEDKYLAKTKT